jgi:hypothetical protein
MREQVIREIVSKIMTDESFRDAVQNRPGNVLKPYGLSQDELETLQSQVGSSGVNVLEQRLSASLGMLLSAECGCPKPGKPSC